MLICSLKKKEKIPQVMPSRASFSIGSHISLLLGFAELPTACQCIPALRAPSLPPVPGLMCAQSTIPAACTSWHPHINGSTEASLPSTQQPTVPCCDVMGTSVLHSPGLRLWGCWSSRQMLCAGAAGREPGPGSLSPCCRRGSAAILILSL